MGYIGTFEVYDASYDAVAVDGVAEHGSVVVESACEAMPVGVRETVAAEKAIEEPASDR